MKLIVFQNQNLLKNKFSVYYIMVFSFCKQFQIDFSGQQHLLFIKILVFYMQTGLLYYFLSSSNFSLFERKVTKEANNLRQVDRLF